MALNPKYILLPPLQNIFRDKDTGLPLRNGYIQFFADNQRTVGKEVFQLTGSPPNYTYATLGQLNTDGSWQVNLDNNGSISNGTNTCNLYWFPFDSNGNVQLYYVVVYNSGGVIQYSLEAEPNYIQSGNATSSIEENYVPNGQFLWHTNIQGIPPNILPGQIQQAVTNVAYGGWTFERPSSSSAVDLVVFHRFPSWSDNPPANPRYACQVSCTTADPGNAFKDLRLKFLNVNRFSSDTDYSTYGFTAISNSGSSLTVEVVLIKNYGTGGSSTVEIPLGPLTITISEESYFLSFIPGDNSGQTIGPNDDDYIQLAIRFPVSDIFNVSITDVLFASGQFTNLAPPLFTEETNSQYAYQSAAGFLDLADYNSFDLYLPVILSPTGLTYDQSIVGKIFASSTTTLSKGELVCDGSSYLYSKYSSDGIPYARLGNVIWNSTLNNYSFGTGSNFVTGSILDGATQNLKLTTNSAGSVTATADGGTPTGFTFSTVTTGNNTYGFSSSYTSSGIVLVELDTIGLIHAFPSAGTTSFSIGIDRDNPSLVYGLMSISNITNTGLAGEYFLLSNTTTDYYVWFKVNGSGSDPAVGGRTGIQIDLLSTYSNTKVAQVIADTLSGYQISNVICNAGSAVTGGSYFTFNTLTNAYYVWYNVSGTGSDPAPSAKIGIEVKILSTDTNSNVASKTQIAINQYQYAVPDLRGMFIRDLDGGSGNDPDVDLRFNNYSDSFGDEIGTMQLDEIYQHQHSYTLYSTTANFVGEGGTTAATITGSPAAETGYTGQTESRPVNMYFQYIIKY